MINLVKLKEQNINIVNKIYDFKAPQKIYVPVNGETFRVGDYVYKNQPFFDTVSSISGFIKGIKKIRINNKLVSALEIENDYEENIKNKLRKKKIINKEELINVLNLFNLKDLSNKFNCNIENMVVTCVDEEGYDYKEFFYLAYHYQEILNTINELMRIFSINKSIIASKSTNLKSIQNVKSIIGTYPNIEVNLLPLKYLISYPPFVCEYLNINYLNTLVLKTSDIYNIFHAINYKSIFETLITISGNAIDKTLVMNVKLYTPLKEILNEYFDNINENYEIYVNGCLKGYKVNDIEEIVVTLNTSVFIINKKENIVATECINCGTCMKICPFKINVKNCYFKEASHKKCIGCGLCNYICPANLKLKEVVGGNKNVIL